MFLTVLTASSPPKNLMCPFCRAHYLCIHSNFPCPVRLPPHTSHTFRIFSCNQAAQWMVLSVRLSVCLSVCYTFFTMFHESDHLHILGYGCPWYTLCPWVKGQGHGVKTCSISHEKYRTWHNRFRTITRVISPIQMKLYGRLLLATFMCPIVFGGHRSNF